MIMLCLSVKPGAPNVDRVAILGAPIQSLALTSPAWSVPFGSGMYGEALLVNNQHAGYRWLYSYLSRSIVSNSLTVGFLR